MTSVGGRGIALRFFAVAIPVSVVCWGWLTLLRLAGELKKLGDAAWDVWMALALGAGCALVHGTAIRFAGARPGPAVALIVISLPLVVVASAAQATYAATAIEEGIGGALSSLATFVDLVEASPGQSMALILGASTGLAVPLANDARWRVLAERASPDRGVKATVEAGALLGMGVLTLAAIGTPLGKVLIVAAGLGTLSLFVAGLTLTLLLAWASLYEDRLQGWKRPVYRP